MSEIFNAYNTEKPINSPELKVKFASLGLPNLKETHDYLIKIGINPTFVDQLAKMLNSLKISATEVLEQEQNIKNADKRLKPKITTLNAKKKQIFLFSTLKAANDDIELEKAA